MNVHISTADPLGLAIAGVINLTEITPTTPKSFVEILLSTGKYSAESLKTIKPLLQYDLTYDLLDTAELDVIFGIAVNTNFLISAFSCASGPEKYPQVKISCIKPTSAGMIKAYGTGITLSMVGGFGIVNKWGATAAASMISSNCSVSMQSIDGMDEVSGDFMTDGIYRYGFKQECQIEAYGAITVPVGAHAIPNDPATPKETAAGPQIYSKSWWTYLDPGAAPVDPDP